MLLLLSSLVMPAYAQTFGQGDWADLDWRQLVRVDDPSHPDALFSSADGSVLAHPPATGSWRREGMGELDQATSDEPVPYVDQQLLRALNVDHWHADGIRGQGVKVGVIDVGWYGGNASPSELGDSLGFDCVAAPHCEVEMDPYRARFGSEGGVHGYGCAETVHDIAPDAQIYRLRAPSTTAIENAVEFAIREELDIISMSMSFFNQSFYDGTGPFAPILKRLEANDILLVVSAGNNADKHWWSPWKDADLDGRLDGDGDNYLSIYLGSGSQTLYVNWNRHGNCADTDLSVLLRGGDLLIGTEDTPQGEEDCEPLERLTVNAPYSGYYQLEIHHEAGSLVGLDVDVLLRSGSVENYMPDRSMTDPATHGLAYTVGAVRLGGVDGYLANPSELFSSQGPNHAGGAKPDIAGPDGLSNITYGPVGFFGTSAATPAVAGLLALIMSDDPSLTPREASAVLNAHAWAQGQQGHSTEFGAGKARLPVVAPESGGCGRRPLLAFFPVFALGAGRRRRR